MFTPENEMNSILKQIDGDPLVVDMEKENKAIPKRKRGADNKQSDTDSKPDKDNKSIVKQLQQYIRPTLNLKADEYPSRLMPKKARITLATEDLFEPKPKKESASDIFRQVKNVRPPPKFDLDDEEENTTVKRSVFPLFTPPSPGLTMEDFCPLEDDPSALRHYRMAQLKAREHEISKHLPYTCPLADESQRFDHINRTFHMWSEYNFHCRNLYGFAIAQQPYVPATIALPAEELQPKLTSVVNVTPVRSTSAATCSASRSEHRVSSTKLTNDDSDFLSTPAWVTGHGRRAAAAQASEKIAQISLLSFDADSSTPPQLLLSKPPGTFKSFTSHKNPVDVKDDIKIHKTMVIDDSIYQTGSPDMFNDPVSPIYLSTINPSTSLDQSRLTAASSKPVPVVYELVDCPLCGKNISSSMIQEHANKCLDDN